MAPGGALFARVLIAAFAAAPSLARSAPVSAGPPPPLPATLSASQSVPGPRGGTASVVFALDLDGIEAVVAQLNVVFDSTHLALDLTDCRFADRFTPPAGLLSFPAEQPPAPLRRLGVLVFLGVEAPMSFTEGELAVCDFHVAADAPIGAVAEIVVEPVIVFDTGLEQCGSTTCGAENGSIVFAPAGPTAPPTPTRTPHPNAPVVQVGSTTAVAGESADFDVTLASPVLPIAGLEVDISFDPLAPIGSEAGDPACSVNPAIDKEFTGFAFRPFGCDVGSTCTGIHALIISISNTDPIPDGSVLFTCRVDVAPEATAGEYALACSSANFSDPVGAAIDGSCGAGGIDVGEGTPGPSRTPTQTRTPAPPTVTPIAGAVAVNVGSAEAVSGGSTEIDVTLASGGEAIAGVQVEVSFDALAPIGANGGNPACTVNPEIDKETTVFGFTPFGCFGSTCTGVRAIVLSISNTDPIPDGAVLFSCRVDVAADAPPVEYLLGCSDAGFSDPEGGAVGGSCNPGSIVVTPGTPGPSATRTTTRTATLPPSTPVPGAASFLIGSTAGVPGGTAAFEVTLDTGGESISGALIDISFDPLAPIADMPGPVECAVNPAIGKDDTSYAFQPFGCTAGEDCTALRAIVFSFSNNSPIPHGAVLFTCMVAISPDAPSGDYPLGCARFEFARPDATDPGASCSPGVVRVGDQVPATATATADLAQFTPTPAESPQATATASATAVETATATPTDTVTQTPVPPATPSATADPTVTITVTPSATAPPSATPTATVTCADGVCVDADGCCARGCRRAEDSDCRRVDFGSSTIARSVAVPGPIAAGDLDGDGIPEIIAGDGSSSNIVVQMPGASSGAGTGGGIGAAESVADLAVADVDGDGDLDVVAAIAHSETVSGDLLVLLGDGALGLSAGVRTALEGRPARLALLEIFGQAPIDVAVATHRGVELLANDDGRFQGVALHEQEQMVSDVAAGAAIDRGRSGFIAALPDADEVKVHRLGPGGGLAATIAVAEPRAVAAGDFTGDGIDDVAVASAEGFVAVYPGRAAGGFGAAVEPRATGPALVRLVRTDLNADGLADLVGLERDAPVLQLLIGRGDGTFAMEAGPAVNGSATGLAVADLNGDRVPDLVIGGDEIAIGIAELNGARVTSGDATGEGDVDAADVQQLIAELFDGDGSDVLACGGGVSRSAAGADANGDRSISAADLSSAIENLDR